MIAADTKFDFLIHCDSFDRTKIVMRLEENNINISEEEDFFSKLNVLIEIEDFEQFFG
jgi:hypothetical protein